MRKSIVPPIEERYDRENEFSQVQQQQPERYEEEVPPNRSSPQREESSEWDTFEEQPPPPQEPEKWDVYGDAAESEEEDSWQRSPQRDTFEEEVESSQQRSASPWQTFGGNDGVPSKESSNWESFDRDDDPPQRKFSRQWEEDAGYAMSPPTQSRSIDLSSNHPQSFESFASASESRTEDPVLSTPTQPDRKVSVESPAPPPPPPTTPLTEEKASARQLWKARKMGTDRLLTLPKFRTGEYRASQPRSIAEVSHEDSVTMISMGSETASEIEDRTTFSRLLQMEFANDLETTKEEEPDDIKASPAQQEQKTPQAEHQQEEKEEGDSLDGKSLPEIAADSVLIADFHQFRTNMEQSLNQEDGSLMSSSPGRSVDVTPSKSDLPNEFQSMLGGEMEPDLGTSPVGQADRELDFFEDDPTIPPINSKQVNDIPSARPELRQTFSDRTTSTTKSEEAIAPSPYDLNQAVMDNIRLSKRAVQVSRDEREGSDADSSAVFGDPESFGAAGDGDMPVNLTPKIMDRARAIEEWNGGLSPAKPMLPLETPSRPFDEREHDDDFDGDDFGQRGKSVRWSGEPNQIRMLESSDDSPSSDGDDEPMDPLAGSFPMEAPSAPSDENLEDFAAPEADKPSLTMEAAGMDDFETETNVSDHWHDRDPDVAVAGDQTIDQTIDEQSSQDVLETADTADSAEWHISPMVSGVSSGHSSPPTIPDESSNEQSLRPALQKNISPTRSTKKVSFVEGDVSPSRKGDKSGNRSLQFTEEEDDPFAFAPDPFFSGDDINNNQVTSPTEPTKDVFDPFGLEPGVEVSIKDSFPTVSNSMFSNELGGNMDGMLDPNEAMSSPFKLLPPRASPPKTSRERRQREAAIDFMDSGEGEYDYSDVAMASSYDPYGEESYLDDEKSEI